MGPPGQEPLQQVVNSQQPSVRMRGLSLLAALAAQAPDNLSALHASGA